MAREGLASRLYAGEANINIVGRRKMWFTIAAALVLISIGSFVVRGFSLGIEFAGGTSFSVPAEISGKSLTQNEISDAVAKAVRSANSEATVGSTQKVGNGPGASYTVRASALSAAESESAKTTLVKDLGVDPAKISDNQVSAAWGGQVTQQAVIGLVIFLVLVVAYLIVRFEWRMAVAALASLVLDLLLTAGVYSLVGFEVTPSTVIGFLTILGYSLYDVVVVFDKVQENTRGITAGSVRTYSEATNLAVNQTLMRSLNTGLVALLPVGGLLFIGAGLLGAGTLKDLGLVLFVGMGFGVLSSILFAAPVLSALKDQDPKIRAHNARVLTRRAGRSEDVARGERRPGNATDSDVPAMAGSTTPRPGARPAARRGANRGGTAGNRPDGKRR
ncbi:Protein-export membrane protein secF [Actinoplanes sp. SE50]|uniref:protein translocase subunit SecF n=1 Tax=unclassified Actinoplanes TaxID=2626549 RepID=UPI00023EBC49|nr:MULTISPECIES: protein translocase subunit SecF [unclassified Actinoplanes]AEV87412.1 Protein-export membrane protein secF [Actinoplanes sp. SE50/110]ATO85814.1 Protein-export membrane protein secF [Actinoplanes sp. SE50]SLM03227.1 protein-export membrane protein SecF [Actinoplanes sp. SE50/110]